MTWRREELKYLVAGSIERPRGRPAKMAVEAMGTCVGISSAVQEEPSVTEIAEVPYDKFEQMATDTLTLVAWEEREDDDFPRGLLPKTIADYGLTIGADVARK